MATKIARPLFKRNMSFIVVRRIRLGNNNYIEPGTEISRKDFRLHYIRSLYMRRRIGPKDHPWTEAALKGTGHIGNVVRNSSKFASPVKDGNKWLILGTDESFRTKKAALEWIEEAEAKIKEEEAEAERLKTLYGSNTLPSEFATEDGNTIPLGDVVAESYKNSGFTIEEWNALADEDREERLTLTVEDMNLVNPDADPDADLDTDPDADPDNESESSDTNGEPGSEADTDIETEDQDANSEMVSDDDSEANTDTDSDTDFESSEEETKEEDDDDWLEGNEDSDTK